MPCRGHCRMETVRARERFDGVLTRHADSILLGGTRHAVSVQSGESTRAHIRIKMFCIRKRRVRTIAGIGPCAYSHQNVCIKNVGTRRAVSCFYAVFQSKRYVIVPICSAGPSKDTENCDFKAACSQLVRAPLSAATAPVPPR